MLSIKSDAYQSKSRTIKISLEIKTKQRFECEKSIKKKKKLLKKLNLSTSNKICNFEKHVVILIVILNMNV